MRFVSESCRDFCENYKAFLDAAKTERETVSCVIARAEAAGFQNLMQVQTQLNCGDKVYFNWMNKALALFVIGQQQPEDGFNFVASHADSPRLDLKANPLYEDKGLALLKTHYYGGIKKYQWGTLPLAIHGVVARKDGTLQQVTLGEDPQDPVFYISDMPKHLSRKQMERKLEEGLQGEELNLLCGGLPGESGTMKNVLAILAEKYGIEADDFATAELEVVPAGSARDVGFDRSFISAYGHDDRVCVYTSLEALLETEKPLHTAAALFVDKEEVGSVGATGMQSYFMENAVAELLDRLGGSSDLRLRRTLSHSRMLSADVVVGLDPTFSDAFDPRNTATIGGGAALVKYVGSNGKKGSNDANAEYLGTVRQVFAKHNIHWQTGEMGKIDLGGGGTISHMAAKYGMSVVDCGVPLLSMHAPFELASKLDIFETYRAYKAFYAEL